MQINTKYNIGDKVLVYNQYDTLTPVTIKAVAVRLFEQEKPTIIYRVKFEDLRELQEYYEDSLYTNVEEVIAAEKRDEQIDLKQAAERFSGELEFIKRKYSKKYEYLEEYGKV